MTVEKVAVGDQVRISGKYGAHAGVITEIRDTDVVRVEDGSFHFVVPISEVAEIITSADQLRQEIDEISQGEANLSRRKIELQEQIKIQRQYLDQYKSYTRQMESKIEHTKILLEEVNEIISNIKS